MNWKPDFSLEPGQTALGSEWQQPDAAPAQKSDGRRERSADSRRRILSAMVEMIENGTPSPTAEAIASKAGVSLRTVFRHFAEMEKLQLEISNLVFGRVRPMLEAPLKSHSWPEVLHESVDRRTQYFEAIAPFKVALDLYRHRSKALAEQHRRITNISRDLLAATLPPAIVRDQELFQILSMLLSVDTWVRLREMQGLSIEEATEAIRRAALSVAPPSLD